MLVSIILSPVGCRHNHCIELYTKTFIADIVGILLLSPDAVGVLVFISSVVVHIVVGLNCVPVLK